MAAKASGSARKRTRTYNLITAVILALTIVVCLLALYLGVAFGSVRAGGEATQPPAGELSATPTVVPPTPNATWTITPTPTSTSDRKSTRQNSSHVKN